MMAKRYFLLCLFFLPMLLGCSNRKNTAVNRFWHKLNTRYNGYFNAREALKEGEIQLIANKKDNFNALLPVFEYGDADQWAAMNPYAEKVLEKGAKMIRKHSMLINGKQYNTWIDDCYLVMGKANYFKKEHFLASGQLRYAANETEKEQTRHEASLWLFKLYNSMNEYADAGAAMRQVDEALLHKKLRGVYHAAVADYFIRQKREDEALPSLEKAILYTRSKSARARYLFIMGQIYRKLENPNAAYDCFAAVVVLKPPYELLFQAKISMALSAGGGDSKNLRKTLKKMLRDDKNLEYLDQIYYALANIDLAEQSIPAAILNFEKSVQVSTQNKEQKGLSYLCLAKIYLEQSEYVNAQAYYDSTAQNISEKHPDYPQVLLLRDHLSAVVTQINIIALNDSLIRLSALSDVELKEKFSRYIEVLKLEDEKRAEQLKKSAVPEGGSTLPGSGGWYFMNNQAKSLGFNEFKKTWGDRKLEDHWRRSRKQTDLFEGEGTPDSVDAGTAKENQRYVLENYLKAIPKTDSAKAVLTRQTEDALFALGTVYREKIRDFPHSNEAFETLYRRNPDSHHFPLGLYNVYLNYKTLKNIDRENFYKELIVKRFPSSEYAKMLTDPGYLKRKEAEENKAQPLYEQAYEAYRSGRKESAQSIVLQAISSFPENHLMPRFELLFALAGHPSQGDSLFAARLKGLIQKHPKTESAETAIQLLKLMGEAIPMPEADTSSGVQDTLPALPPKEYPYKYNEKTEHMVIVVIDNISFIPDPLKNYLSNFNEESFASNKLSISNTLLANRYQLLNIRRFAAAENAITYIKALEKSAYRSKAPQIPIKVFPISLQNLGLLFREKEIEGYEEWYQLHYK